MGKDALHLVLIALSCVSTCLNRGYSLSLIHKNHCYCIDRYDLDGSWELPTLPNWLRKPEEKDEAQYMPRFDL